MTKPADVRNVKGNTATFRKCYKIVQFSNPLHLNVLVDGLYLEHADGNMQASVVNVFQIIDGADWEFGACVEHWIAISQA